MIEIIENICFLVITLFLAFSGMVAGGYLFAKNKQKLMIIFTLIMFILSIALCVIFILIKHNIPPVIGTITAR